MKNKKFLMMMLAMVLVCVVSVAGTLAYLTATTQSVKNTFVAAELADLVLDESKANGSNGNYTLDTNTRVQANNYTVVPGVNLPKDPKVTVKGLEQTAYLYIEVIDALPSTITWEMRDTWTEVTGKTGKNGGKIYAYNAIIQPNTADQEFFIIKDDTMVVASNYEKTTAAQELTFYAYLCQSAGFSSAAEAYTACFE